MKPLTVINLFGDKFIFRFNKRGFKLYIYGTMTRLSILINNEEIDIEIVKHWCIQKNNILEETQRYIYFYYCWKDKILQYKKDRIMTPFNLSIINGQKAWF